MRIERRFRDDNYFRYHKVCTTCTPLALFEPRWFLWSCECTSCGQEKNLILLLITTLLASTWMEQGRIMPSGTTLSTLVAFGLFLLYKQIFRIVPVQVQSALQESTHFHATLYHWQTGYCSIVRQPWPACRRTYDSYVPAFDMARRNRDPMTKSFNSAW